MIKHIVMWKLKDNAEGNPKSLNAVIVKERLEALKGIIPEIKKINVGINFGAAPQDNWDVILDSEFESMEALDIYQKHPAHKEVAAFVGLVRESRACVDYEV